MSKQIILAISILVLIYQNAFSQNDALTEFRTKFDIYTQKFPSEKLYVHTDKDFYTAGEIIWFKIYGIAADKQSAVMSKVAYVEILDEHHSAIAKAKIALDEKGGSGSIELPLSANSGYYTLRAYTNWMKNFDATVFFDKRITIVNPLKSLNAEEKTVRYGSIELFPEGGNLVNGIPSQISFKISNADGKIAPGKGFLLNEHNDTLLWFSPYKFGIGNFLFTPDAAHRYKAVFIFDDNSIVSKSLPQIYPQGYVMHVEEQGENYKVIVRSKQSSVYPELFLIAQNHRNIQVAKRNVIADGVAVFSLDKSELGEGISQITIFNNEKQPVCERLVFIPPAQKTDLEIKPSKEVYDNREQVSLALSSSVPANLSLSVFQLDALQTKDAGDINSYVWLESELGSGIENPQYYLSNTEEAKKAANNLMLTYGWRRFKWDRVLNGAPAIQFSPELSGQIISCKVTEAKTGKPAPDVQVFLSIPETSYKLYFGSSDDSGIVKINVKDFFGNSELVLQVKDNQPEYQIEVLNPFSEEYSAIFYPPFAIYNDQKALLENHSIAMQAQHIYRADSIQRFLAPAIKDTFPFFGEALYTYHLDDYTRFTTMEEVLREYVREINVGVKGSGDLKFKIFNENNRKNYTNDILVVVDGVPVFNTAKIFSMDPLKIRSLDIINRNYVLGTSIFYGLASFSTYKGNYEGVDIDPRAISLDYEGLQMKREFYSPDYSTEQQLKNRIPDLRTTLFWSPDIATSQKIQFYTGDNKGKYIAVVQGLDSNGKPVTAASEFEVK